MGKGAGVGNSRLFLLLDPGKSSNYIPALG